VVLLTGAFEPVDEGRARSVGCDGILVKPFEPQLVISRVKDLLAGRQPAGMWSSAPVAQGPVRQAAPDLSTRTPAAGSAAADPLEAYFDQLDAAFSSASTTAAAAEPVAGPPAQARETIPLSRRPVPAAPQGNSGDPLSNWDPDLIGDPARPAAIEVAPPAPRTIAPLVVAVAPPASIAPPAPAAPSAAPVLPASLVDAFSALLSAEQKFGLSPSVATSPSPSPTARESAPAVITDDMIEAVAERVLAKLSTQSRPTILDVAERLVREEIERLKQ